VYKSCVHQYVTIHCNGNSLMLTFSNLGSSVHGKVLTISRWRCKHILTINLNTGQNQIN
jgi:hypothetical protein